MTETLLCLPRTRAAYKRARHLRRFFKRQNRQLRGVTDLVPHCRYAVRVTKAGITLLATRVEPRP